MTLSAVPAWAIVVAEVFALVTLGITAWHIAVPSYRRGIPGGLIVIAAVTNVQAAIQERTWRVAAWLLVLVSLTFAIVAGLFKPSGRSASQLRLR